MTKPRPLVSRIGSSIAAATHVATGYVWAIDGYLWALALWGGVLVVFLALRGAFAMLEERLDRELA